MRIELRDIGRRFDQQHIFSGITADLLPGETWALLGGNGSGKSTLIKLIYGALTPSDGSIKYFEDEGELEGFAIARSFSLAGPYLELMEELSVREFLETYQKFRPLRTNLTVPDLIAMARLEEAAEKAIRHLSSGMKQRLRLTLALGVASAVVILDEPTSNLDPAGVSWYQALLKEHLGQRSLLIGSNFNEAETFYCQQELRLEQYK